MQHIALRGAAASVIVGNPAIADVTMQKNGVVVITGRRAGRTNFIALDRKGAIISESAVAVSLSNEGRVLVRRGTLVHAAATGVSFFGAGAAFHFTLPDPARTP